jgi:hypothetical protein
MKRKPKKKKSQRLNYWQQLEQKRMYAANQGFMLAIMDLAFVMRFKLGWQICWGTNPMTGKRHKRKCK